MLWQTLSPPANFQFGLQLYCHHQQRSVNEIRLVKMTDNLQYLHKSFILLNFHVTRLISTIWMGIYKSSECKICQMPNSTMDEEHPLHCTELNMDQQVLKNTIKIYCNATAMMRKLIHLCHSSDSGVGGSSTTTTTNNRLISIVHAVLYTDLRISFSVQDTAAFIINIITQNN